MAPRLVYMYVVLEKELPLNFNEMAPGPHIVNLAPGSSHLRSNFNPLNSSLVFFFKKASGSLHLELNPRPLN